MTTKVTSYKYLGYVRFIFFPSILVQPVIISKFEIKQKLLKYIETRRNEVLFDFYLVIVKTWKLVTVGKRVLVPDAG